MRRTTWSLVAIAALAGCKETSVSVITEPPIVTITNPTDGATVDQGVDVLMRGVVADSKFDGEDLARLAPVWSVDGVRVCSDAVVTANEGVTECAHAFDAAGEATVTLVVTNPDGESDETAVTLNVAPNTAPQADIVAPVPEGIYYSDQPIVFEGVVHDAEDDGSELSVTWSSSVDGDLGFDPTPTSSGDTSGFTTLTEGRHLVSLDVTDSTGLTGEAIVNIEVGPPNSAPACEITAPDSGTTVGKNATVLFEATATDIDVPTSMLTVEWYSDKDGLLATSVPSSSGAVFYAHTGMSVATHTITLTVTDEVGASCVDVILLEVGDGPTVAITSPLDGDVWSAGQAVPFEATVSDSQDLPNEVDLSWESSIDGVFSTTRANSSGVAKFTFTDLTPGTHTITLTGTDTTAFEGVDSIGLRINALPTQPDIEILPDPPTSSDALKATMLTPSTDAEGDPITYYYAWYQDGTLTSHAGDTVPSSDTTRGEVWRVTVTPHDGYGEGLADSDTVTIGNSAPSLASVDLTPDPATVADTFTCSPAGGSDPDGDTVTYTYAWKVNGSTAGGTSNKLTSTDFKRGDDVSCVVTPSDGTIGGLAVESAVVTVGNSKPTVASAALTPTAAYESSTLTCAPGATSDLDGDTVTLVYDWIVSGASLGVDASTLDGSRFRKGDTVTCTVTPNDGLDDGATKTSNTVTIGDSTPTVGTVTLTPDPGYETSTLACNEAGFADADGDAISYTYAWKVNSVTIGATTDTLTGSSFSKGNTVSCSVVASDGTTSAAAVTSNVVTIRNSAPSATSVAISPSSPSTSDLLTATVSGWADADGDTEGYQFQWYVDGVAVTGGTGSTLGADKSSKGQVVTVTATPWDGTDTGTTLTSAGVTIQNSAPSVTTASLTPTTSYETSLLSCAASGASDADSDTISYTYEWVVSGATVAPSSSTLDGTYFDKGDTVTCKITPSDGSASGTTVTSNTVTIANTPPVTGTPSLSPTTAYETTTFGCVPGANTDADTDSVTVTYGWEVNGAAIAVTTSTLNGTYFKKGDAVNCVVTPNDGTASGTAKDSNVVTILNSAPSATSVSISPSLLFTDTDAMGVVSGWSDADSDTEGYTWQWYKNSAVVTGATTSILDDTKFVKHDDIYVVATPTDGTTSGSPVTSDTVTISNTPPTTPVVDVTPNDAEPGEALYCTVTTTSTDKDGDTVTYNYVWTRDGSPTGYTSSSVPASEPKDGETWTCTVTPWDGEANGTAAADSQAVIDRTAPDRPIIDPISPYRNSTSVTLTGTAEASSTVYITAVCDSGTYSYTTTSSGAGSWSYTTSIPYGEYCSFSVYAKDATGNTSPTSNTVATESCAPVDDWEDSTSYGDTCADSVDEWLTLSDAGTSTIAITGNILDATDGDWYVVRTSQSVLTSGTNKYHFEVNLITGAADFAFTVYKGDCASTSLECDSGGTEGAGYTQYEVYPYDAGTGSGHLTPTNRAYCANGTRYNACDDLSDVYYVHVYRIVSSYNCNPYEIEITNGL